MLVGDRVGLALHRVAGLRHGERAARARAALLDDVGELVGDQLVAGGRARVVLAAGEVDVGAGRERARGDRAVELVGGVVGVDADVGEVAERAGHAAGDAGVEAVPPPRVASIVDCTSEWTVPSGLIPAPCSASRASGLRPSVEENAWLPTSDASWAIGARSSRSGSGCGSGARIRSRSSCSSSLLPVHRGRASHGHAQETQGAMGQPDGPDPSPRCRSRSRPEQRERRGERERHEHRVGRAQPQRAGAAAGARPVAGRLGRDPARSPRRRAATGESGTSAKRSAAARPAAISRGPGSSPSSCADASRSAGSARSRRSARRNVSRSPPGPAAARIQVATATSSTARSTRRSVSSSSAPLSSPPVSAAKASSAGEREPERDGVVVGPQSSQAGISHAVTPSSSAHDVLASSSAVASSAATTIARGSKRPEPRSLRRGRARRRRPRPAARPPASCRARAGRRRPGSC